MKILLLLWVLSQLVACASVDVDSAIGIDDTDNAVQCIRAQNEIDGRNVDIEAQTSRIEFPQDLELGTLTPELVDAIAELAGKMGCVPPS